jgi:hypothetical protein
MQQRTEKQIIIGLGSGIVLLGFFFALLLFFTTSPPESPLSPVAPPRDLLDRAQLANLEIELADFFEIRKFATFDAVALVKNPNPEYGGREVRYEFIFYDASDTELLKVPGRAFILPKHSRYIIEQAIRVPQKPARVELSIQGVDWQQLAPVTPPVLELSELNLARDEAKRVTRLSGVVRNTSPYNLKNVEVQAVLLDPKSGKAIAGGKTNMQDLLRDSARFSEISWPYIVDRDVTIDARVESNFFENSNFIREYGLGSF